MVRKDADLSIEVAQYDQAFSEIQRMAAQCSGFLVSSSTNIFDSGQKSGQVTLRVPAERFDMVLQQLKKLSQRLEGDTISGKDVTEEFYDITARLQNSNKTEQRLLAILSSAKSVKDILEVEKVLSSTREEIERLEARNFSLRSGYAFDYKCTFPRTGCSVNLCATGLLGSDQGWIQDGMAGSR